MATSSFQHTAVVRAEMRGSNHSYNWSMNPKSQGRLPRSGRIMVSREWSPMQPIFHLHVSPGIHPVGWISVSGCTSRVSGRCAQPGYSLWPQATTPPQWSGVAHHCTLALVIPPVALGVAQPRVGPPLVGTRPGGPPAPPRQGTPTLSVAPPHPFLLLLAPLPPPLPSTALTPTPITPPTTIVVALPTCLASSTPPTLTATVATTPRSV